MDLYIRFYIFTIRYFKYLWRMLWSLTVGALNLYNAFNNMAIFIPSVILTCEFLRSYNLLEYSLLSFSIVLWLISEVFHLSISLLSTGLSPWFLFQLCLLCEIICMWLLCLLTFFRKLKNSKMFYCSV